MSFVSAPCSVKRTINIGVNGAAINQWLVQLNQADFTQILKRINPSLADVRVNVFNFKGKAPYKVAEGDVQSPYDIIVSDSEVIGQSVFNKVFKRHVKSVQHALIREAVKKTGAVSFYDAPCWELEKPDSAGIQCTNIGVPFLEKGLYIIRPEEGARSIGQIIVDTNIIDIHHVFTRIKSNWFDKDFVPPAGVTINSGFEKVQGESFEQFMCGFFIQKVVQNVRDEYRVITDYSGNISRVMTRPRDDVGNGDVDYKAVIDLHDELIYAPPSVWTSDTHQVFTAAIGDLIGAIKGAKRPLAKVFDIKNKMLSEIEAVLRELNIPCNSVDLFITSYGSTVKWGIFEYCNQYGLGDWKSRDVRALFMDFYFDLLSEYFNKKDSS